MRVSVIIPTRDRPSRLARTLDALAAQELHGAEAEAIVVDNGSRHGIGDIVERAAAFPWSMTVEHEPEPGASAARNTGLRAARFEIVLFLGDDTRPDDPHLVRRHVELHRQRPEPTYAVLGRVVWAPELRVTPVMSWLEDRYQFDFAGLERGPARGEHFYTAHVSVKRSLVVEVGGFDERLPFLQQDTELGARLFDRGLELDYRPELVVHHDHPMTLAAWWRRMRLAESNARVLHGIRSEHPPIGPTPWGPRWSAVRGTGRALASAPTEWRLLPRRARERLYHLVHWGGYVDGYRGGAAARPSQGGNAGGGWSAPRSSARTS